MKAPTREVFNSLSQRARLAAPRACLCSDADDLESQTSDARDSSSLRITTVSIIAPGAVLLLRMPYLGGTMNEAVSYKGCDCLY